MGIYFRNSDLKKLTSEQFKTLGEIADACNAETIDEASDEARQQVKERCEFIKREAEANAARQEALRASFV